jgi:hypothetical protein
MQTMHLLPGVAIQTNLELKTQPKPVLGSVPLAFAPRTGLYWLLVTQNESPYHHSSDMPSSLSCLECSTILQHIL